MTTTVGHSVPSYNRTIPAEEDQSLSLFTVLQCTLLGSTDYNLWCIFVHLLILNTGRRIPYYCDCVYDFCRIRRKQVRLFLFPFAHHHSWTDCILTPVHVLMKMCVLLFLNVITCLTDLFYKLVVIIGEPVILFESLDGKAAT